jgi:hypothetical protein
MPKKAITTFATGCSLLTQRSTLMDNSLETWVRFWSGNDSCSFCLLASGVLI